MGFTARILHRVRAFAYAAKGDETMTLYIDACLRPESRTRRLAEVVLAHIQDDIERVVLSDEMIPYLTEEGLSHRFSADLDSPCYDIARQFAAADTLIIAAPYYDLSFPAILRAYIEQIQVGGISFVYGEDDLPHSLAKVKRLIYVSTAGGHVIGEHLGYRYLCEVMRYFYGVTDSTLFCAEGLDLKGADAEKILLNTETLIHRTMGT